MAAAVDTGDVPPCWRLRLHGNFLPSLGPSLAFLSSQAAAPVPLGLPPEPPAQPQALPRLCLLSRPRVSSFSAWAPPHPPPLPSGSLLSPLGQAAGRACCACGPSPLVSESEPCARPSSMLLPSLACPALATSPPALELPPGLPARPVPRPPQVLRATPSCLQVSAEVASSPKATSAGHAICPRAAVGPCAIACLLL